MSFTYGGLFSGIGGLELACEQLGGKAVFMCENDAFCQRILRRRFPDVPLIEDVHDVHGSDWQVDGLVGGFPCQDISAAGKGVGIGGERSGLWKQFARVIKELRPKIVLIENVALLKSRGLDVVLTDLHAIGYAAEWDTISAAAVGAPHLRERIWIIARPRELAQEPVYGEASGSFTMFGKLPRAGRMSEKLEELVPIAPRKTKRRDGWSYWDGASLWAEGTSGLWPTPDANERRGPHGDHVILDHKHLTGTKAQRTLTAAAAAVERGLLPTPDGSASQLGEGTKTWLERREKLKQKGYNGNGAGIPLTIAALLDAEGKRLWPTTTTDAKAARNETSGRSSLDSKHHSGTTLLDALMTLLDALIRNGDAAPPKMWRSPTQSDWSGGPMDPARRVAQGHTLNLQEQVWTGGGAGSLNPTWVEWLMGLPLWWTDPTVPTEFTTHVPWDSEPLHVAPRTATKIPLRAPRLKAIGNSVVSQCALYVLARALVATPVLELEAAA